MTFPASLDVPQSVREIIERLEGEGYEAWCVGGAIRDALIDTATPGDFDVATSAPPNRVQELFPHTVPVGIKYGTVGVLDRDRVLHEVTTFRRDVRTDGRHAEVEFGVSLEDDLARRDFTMNAIAYHPLRGEWRDPFRGQEDIDRRLVRAVGEPEQRFREDYLRILRGIRFAARFGFQIEAETWDAAQREVAGIGWLSAERVRDEWFKSLRTAKSIRHLVGQWIRVGAAAIWLPELGATEDASRLPFDLGADEHLGGVPLEGPGLPARVRDPIILNQLLCLDPVAVLQRLKSSNTEIARAAAMRMGPAQPEGADEVEVRRWMAAVGDAADDLAVLWVLRNQSPWPWDALVRRIRARGDPLSRADLAVSGDDLLDAGLSPGPAVGKCLESLLAVVVDNPATNTREALMALVRAGCG